MITKRVLLNRIVIKWMDFSPILHQNNVRNAIHPYVRNVLNNKINVY